MSPQQEGMLTKLQDRNLFFGGMSKICPHSFKGSRSVKHLATQCGGMLDLYYKKRHDEVVRCLHFLYTKKYGLNRSSKLKNYKVEKVISNDRIKIKSDIKMETALSLEYNKPDLMIHDRRTKEIPLVEVRITNKIILAKTELRKSRRYDVLKNELRVMYPGCKVITVPVVMIWDGLVTRNFKGYMKQLEVTDRLLAYMQSVVLKRTCESILEDRRRIQIGDWLEDEVDEMMAQLETQPAGPKQGAQLMTR
ncbi:uncharacterized protein LOC120850049 [Ixodes scapularis]|uniref:uncharacterized protein LOC120850049 n=1 Tax=Ixodes scapularis TaxID=6945 RepID=UPI001A9FAF6F|nr:uncharacterized protein LOC120850049 [Ixodes scapularis]